MNLNREYCLLLQLNASESMWLVPKILEEKYKLV